MCDTICAPYGCLLVVLEQEAGYLVANPGNPSWIIDSSMTVVRNVAAVASLVLYRAYNYSRSCWARNAIEHASEEIKGNWRIAGKVTDEYVFNHPGLGRDEFSILH